MRPHAARLLALGLLLLPSCRALQATPDSDCASLCADGPSANASSFSTLTTDLTCTDSDYVLTDKGQRFEACNSCLRNSTAVSGDLNDQGALLHNIRATVDLCIWGFPNASSTVSSPCDIDYGCDPLKAALEANYSDVGFEAQYAYCAAANGSFLGASLQPCIQCYQSSTTQSYLANFLLTLQAACQQKPAPGQTLKVAGDLFSSTPVNITVPTPAAPAATATGGASRALSTGALIGTVLGCLAAVAALCGVGFVCHRKRQRAAQLRARRAGAARVAAAAAAAAAGCSESGVSRASSRASSNSPSCRRDSESTAVEAAEAVEAVEAVEGGREETDGQGAAGAGARKSFLVGIGRAR